MHLITSWSRDVVCFIRCYVPSSWRPTSSSRAISRTGKQLYTEHCANDPTEPGNDRQWELNLRASRAKHYLLVDLRNRSTSGFSGRLVKCMLWSPVGCDNITACSASCNTEITNWGSRLEATPPSGIGNVPSMVISHFLALLELQPVWLISNLMVPIRQQQLQCSIGFWEHWRSSWFPWVCFRTLSSDVAYHVGEVWFCPFSIHLLLKHDATSNSRQMAMPASLTDRRRLDSCKKLIMLT